MTLEILDQNPVNLDFYLDAANELRARWGTQELSEHGYSVLTRSDDHAIRVNLQAPSGWSLGASHENDDGELVHWSAGESDVWFEFVKPTTDALSVDVIAMSGGTAAEEKPRKVHIDAKPGGALPDRP